MLLQEIFNQLETNNISKVDRDYTKETNINGNHVKVNIYMEQDSDIAFVDFSVNDTQSLQRDTPIQTTIKTLQFVISCMNDYVHTYPLITFCFGADEEHEKMYDSLLPRLASKYNMYFKKSSINLPTFLKAKEWLKSKIQKNHVKLVCLYYIYPKISSKRNVTNLSKKTGQLSKSTTEYVSQQNHVSQ